MKNTPRIAFVSGANRGIGLALVRALSRELPEGSAVYLGCRRLADGRRAAEALAAEGLEATPIRFDLVERATHEALAAHLREAHGGIDILVLNGAVAASPDRPNTEQVRPMITANNHGNHAALETLTPLLRQNARVLVVASGLGTLASLPELVRDRFADPHATPEAIAAVMDDYVTSVETGQDGAEGWPEWINLPSKVGQVASLRAFVRRFDAAPDRPTGVLVNAVCPGWTDTEAARPYLAAMPDVDAQSPDEAAVDLLWLATRPPGTAAPHGELVQHRRVLPFAG